MGYVTATAPIFARLPSGGAYLLSGVRGAMGGGTPRRSEFDVIAPPRLRRGPVSADVVYPCIPPFRRFSGTTLRRALRHAQELGCVPSSEQGRHAGSIAC